MQSLLKHIYTIFNGSALGGIPAAEACTEPVGVTAA
jgi:hypothetical protein